MRDLFAWDNGETPVWAFSDYFFLFAITIH